MMGNGVSGLRWPGFVLSAFATLFLCLVGFVGHAKAASGCGLTTRAGLHELSFESDGVKRHVLVFVPPGYTGKSKVPVVFDLHGSNSFAKAQMERSDWPDVARENGFIVAAPEGGLVGKLPGTHAWNVPGVTAGNGPDDVEYLSEVISQVKASFCVDSTQLYASGYSGGGRMLSQYICNGNRDFSAAGFVMSLRAGYPIRAKGEEKGKWLPDPQTCHPAQPVSIIAFWGLKDNTNPYAGGGKPYWQYGGQTALRRWAELDGCNGTEKTSKGVKVSSAEFDRCKGGARILSYTIAGQTHDWPAKTVGFSSVGMALDKRPVADHNGLYAAKRMWMFFANTHGLLMADGVAKGNCTTKGKLDGAMGADCPVLFKTAAKSDVVDGQMAADAR